MEFRRVQYFNINSYAWVDILMRDLKSGMLFRMFDDEEPFVFDGNTHLLATSDGYINSMGIDEIEMI